MASCDLRKKLDRFGKVDLIYAPTPFARLENMTRELGGPEIYIKRDDLTGLAFGGNKSRKLQHIIFDILEKKCDAVITWASLQSNWCLQTAAAARRYGIAPILLLFSPVGVPEEFDGNLLLDHILDADIHIQKGEEGRIVTMEEAEAHVEVLMRQAMEWGYTPYHAPIGGSFVGGSMDRPLGAIGYVEGFLELYDQAQRQGLSFTHVIHASGSGGTQAGLVVGAAAVDDSVHIIGISVSEEKKSFASLVKDICRDTMDALKLGFDLPDEKIDVRDNYLQAGYGVVTKEVCEILRKTAVLEGIYLDPVYTGKAMIALTDLIKKGELTRDHRAVFYHTGGTAALFPHRKTITSHLTD
ncbi:MAG: D-cysteine desulfhydrase family protein [Acidobacteria bacterium]|nr:D-cysteine desulfhydrase family protein [Acidobacteriota bacterium]